MDAIAYSANDPPFWKEDPRFKHIMSTRLCSQCQHRCNKWEQFLHVRNKRSCSATVLTTNKCIWPILMIHQYCWILVLSLLSLILWYAFIVAYLETCPTWYFVLNGVGCHGRTKTNNFTRNVGACHTVVHSGNTLNQSSCPVTRKITNRCRNCMFWTNPSCQGKFNCTIVKHG